VTQPGRRGPSLRGDPDDHETVTALVATRDGHAASLPERDDDDE